MKISDEVLDRMALLALDDPWLKQRVKHARMQAAGDVLLRSLTPEDLDTLAQRLGFELAKKTDDRCSSRFDTSWLEGYTQGWNDRHEKMMSWRDAEMGDG